MSCLALSAFFFAKKTYLEQVLWAEPRLGHWAPRITKYTVELRPAGAALVLMSSAGVVVVECRVLPGAAGLCRVQDVMELKLWFNQEKLNYQRSPEIIILIVQFTWSWLTSSYQHQQIKFHKFSNNQPPESRSAQF